MISSATLFSLTLLATGGLYVCMLAYFNGLVGTKRRHTRIVWNSEPIIWIITLLLTFSIAFRIAEPVPAEGPGIWYLIGTGNLMVIYTYLIIELARHDLPKAGYWITAALSAAAVIFTVATIAGAFMSQSMDLLLYKDVLAMLLVALTHILMLVLIFNLLRSFRSSILTIWMADASSRERLRAGGITVTATGDVTTPEGAASDLNAVAQPESAAATLQPGSNIVVDFGIRRIEDHGFRSDLRVVGGDADQSIAVEVSNDKQNWVACEREDAILTDWDVPYFDSPWRYVRVSNQSDQPIQIADVYDLD